MYPALLFIGPLWETALVFLASFTGLLAISGAWTKYLLVPLALWERIVLGAGGIAIFVPLPDIIQYPVLAALLAFMGYLFYRMKTEKVCSF